MTIYILIDRQTNVLIGRVEAETPVQAGDILDIREGTPAGRRYVPAPAPTTPAGYLDENQEGYYVFDSTGAGLTGIQETSNEFWSLTLSMREVAYIEVNYLAEYDLRDWRGSPIWFSRRAPTEIRK